MKKYVVWKSAWEGEYVKADYPAETEDTVSFMAGELTVRAYLKSEILKYEEVEE